MKINKKLNLAPKPLKESVKIHKSESKPSKKNSNKKVAMPMPMPEEIKEKKIKTKDAPKKTKKNIETAIPDKIEQTVLTTKSPTSEDSKTNVCDETVIKAINVIKQLDKLAQEKKTELFAEDGVISVQIDCIKIPKCVKRKLRLTLPHWLVTDTSDVCLFVCDLKRGSRVDHEPTVEHYEDLLREKDIKMIKTVLPVRQLKVEYDQIEMRRRLMTQHDFFLVDSRVSGLLAHKLGKMFFQKNMLPTPVRMHAKDLQSQIKNALHKTVMRLHGEGTTYSMRIAHTQHTVEQTCENIQAVLLQISEQFPGGWENIRSVYIKSAKSMAIPIYMTLRNKNTVVRPIVKSLREDPEIVEGELSTVLGGTVYVHPDGTVKLKVDKSVALEDNSDIEDEKVEETPAKKRKVVEKPTKEEPTKKQKKMNGVSSKKDPPKLEEPTEENTSDEDDSDGEEEDDDVPGEELGSDDDSDEDNDSDESS